MAEQTVFDFTATNIRGEEQSLDAFRGKVLLIVNTASKCGFTPQFEGLQSLYADLKDQGVEVLGFPCNQFKNQDPADDEAISEFCSLNYGVDFPMFSKIDVNGPDAHPLFKHLKQQAKGLLGSEGVKWNFTKFLVNQKGEVVGRYSPTTKPDAIREDIEKLLG